MSFVTVLQSQCRCIGCHPSQNSRVLPGYLQCIISSGVLCLFVLFICLFWLLLCRRAVLYLYDRWQKKRFAAVIIADWLVFLRGKGVCLCPIRVSASERLSRGGKWRLVTQRCVILKTVREQLQKEKLGTDHKNKPVPLL